MRIIWAIAVLFALSLFTPSISSFAQDQRDEDKAKPQDQAKPPEPKEERKGNMGKQGAAGQPEQEKQEQPPVREEHKKQNEAPRPSQQSHEGMPQTGHNQRPVQAQRGKKIPDPKFRASFGSQHTFKVQRTQVVNVQQPTIVVGGYSFILVDVWPVEWGFDDPCYIDFVDDEYFLFDTFHPGIRIALFVVE